MDPFIIIAFMDSFIIIAFMDQFIIIFDPRVCHAEKKIFIFIFKICDLIFFLFLGGHEHPWRIDGEFNAGEFQRPRGLRYLRS